MTSWISSISKKLGKYLTVFIIIIEQSWFIKSSLVKSVVNCEFHFRCWWPVGHFWKHPTNTKQFSWYRNNESKLLIYIAQRWLQYEHCRWSHPIQAICLQQRRIEISWLNPESQRKISSWRFKSVNDTGHYWPTKYWGGPNQPQNQPDEYFRKVPR